MRIYVHMHISVCLVYTRIIYAVLVVPFSPIIMSGKFHILYIYKNNFGEPFSTFMIIGGWVTVTVPSFKIPACPSQIASQTHNLTEAHQATRLEKGHCQMPPAYMVCGAPRMYTSYIYWIPQPYTSYPKCLCHSTGGRS